MERDGKLRHRGRLRNKLLRRHAKLERKREGSTRRRGSKSSSTDTRDSWRSTDRNNRKPPSPNRFFLRTRYQLHPV